MYGRRDVNGKANAGLTLGIIGTALGAWALFGNRRSAGVLGTGTGLMGDGSTNINVVGVGAGNGTAPTAFQAWAKSCEDTLALQGGLYQWALTQQSQRFQDRQVIDGEMFGLLMRCTMSKTVRNISVKNTICKKPTKFVINSKIN